MITILFFLQQIHETEYCCFFWRIYSFYVFWCFSKIFRSGWSPLHSAAVMGHAQVQRISTILGKRYYCYLDNLVQYKSNVVQCWQCCAIHINSIISKVAGLLLDSGANSKLRNNQGLKKNNSQYLSIECINSRELGRPESIKFFMIF